MSSSLFKPTREFEPKFLLGSKIWLNREENLPQDPVSFKEFKSEFDLSHMTNEKRIRELYHGRFVSKKLIQTFIGNDPGWLPIGEKGKPVLPHEIIASFSHSGPWVAVWVNLKTPSVRSIGVDLQTWISDSEANLLNEGFKRRSFHIPNGLDRFSFPEKITIIFSILEATQKILGNANEPFISISNFKLDIDSETRHWRSHAGSLLLEGQFETHSEFTLAYGLCLGA